MKLAAGSFVNLRWKASTVEFAAMRSPTRRSLSPSR
jgi:hypothetical protein